VRGMGRARKKYRGEKKKKWTPYNDRCEEKDYSAILGLEKKNRGGKQSDKVGLRGDSAVSRGCGKQTKRQAYVFPRTGYPKTGGLKTHQRGGGGQGGGKEEAKRIKLRRNSLGIEVRHSYS